VVAALNKIIGHPQQLELLRCISLSANVCRFSPAASQQVHNATAGGSDRAVRGFERCRTLLKKLADRNTHRLGNPAQRFGPGFEAPVFDARKIRGRDARSLADLLLGQVLLVSNLDHPASNAHVCASRLALLPPILTPV
jgi:hypothetical protein